MHLAAAVALLCSILLGIGATLNAHLMSMRFMVATGYGTASAPVILLLVLFAAASWILFLLAVSMSQGFLLRKIERLSATLAEKEREVLRVQADARDESAEMLRGVAVRLERRLREPEPLPAGRKGEPAGHAGAVESRAA